ncbi:sigma-54-dependent Fis family transcriptional regulator [candidate division KSB1 bacterium]|nr:sigma-54-dependent Fis family transcriptional regulator [candidate division KSB1 bacterium]
MMQLLKILIVDDEVLFSKQISRWLESENYSIEIATSGEEALEKVKFRPYSLILLDLCMPGMGGFDVLKFLRRDYPEICVIVLTASADVETTKRALREGAADFFEKPVNFDLLLPRIESIFERFKLQSESEYQKQDEIHKYSFNNIIGKSTKMQDVFQKIKKVAQTDSTVLILGESGTGKELIASVIHYNSLRADKNFIVIDCDAIVDSIIESELFGYEKGAFTGATKRKLGKLERAKDGSVYLDEVGDLSSNLQTKLLRFLQERHFERVGGEEVIKVDVRVIVATNKVLEKSIQEGKFRQDLYYRLNVFPIQLPPLRERKEDIPLLVEHLIQKNNYKLKRNITGIKPDALELLLEYHYPGNIRELENIIERAVLLSEKEFLAIENLPSNLGNRQTKATSVYFTLPHTQAKEAFEKDYFEQVLKNHKGNISRACKFAGMDRTNFKDKMKKYGISRPKSGNQDVDED